MSKAGGKKAVEELQGEEQLIPDPWFKACLEELEPGVLFIPGAGEGRSAVYAALQGWEVHAIDRSGKQRERAMALAEEWGVGLDYEVGELEGLELEPDRYDAIAVLYVQLPPIPRKKFHARMLKGLREGGHWIMQAFSKGQIGYYSGGPPDIDRLYSLEDIEQDLVDLELMDHVEEEVELLEGERSLGAARVIRILARRSAQKDPL